MFAEFAPAEAILLQKGNLVKPASKLHFGCQYPILD